MASLPSELRRPLERAIIRARDTAERAAEAALTSIAVDRDRVPATLDDDQRRLRNALRARSRQLGGGDLQTGWLFLLEEVAYEQWHRMLFARFLAENDLLIHPDHQVPITLDECAELAPEEGETDAWQLAARYASAMLPGIFRLDDPSAQVRLTPEGRQELERILIDLPAPLFRADDALGWVYQFWQSKRKDEVNASERKIGGADLPPVTQLFTEDYMVRFLLENSLGAWWAARHPRSPLIKEFKFLRFNDDGTPAAGTFSGWPDRAALITMMDPCCGSGHFDVAAFEMLRRMRMEEEDLSAADAAAATLRDNIFGLELDPRCTQIAAFALVLAAWKAGGYRPLPVPNIACSGIPVEGQLETWTELAGKDESLRAALERLYHLFRNAPDLGSLINPVDVPERDRMFTPDYAHIEPLLEEALSKERNVDDPASVIFGTAAEGVLRAARFLSSKYTCVATNVPYLGSGNQNDRLKEFCSEIYPHGKADLATVFLERCLSLCAFGGTVSSVIQQYWLFLGTYLQLRQQILTSQTWNIVARLGTGAFETISGEVVNVALIVVTQSWPEADHLLAGIDVSSEKSAIAKAEAIQRLVPDFVLQTDQLRNPDSRVTLHAYRPGRLLGTYATATEGLSTGDRDRFVQLFWEQPVRNGDWEYLQSASEQPNSGGRSETVFWQKGKGYLSTSTAARIQGDAAWGKHGILIARVSSLTPSLYQGPLFDKSCVAIIPTKESMLPALWAYCNSGQFKEEIRKLDKKTYVTTSVFLKIPFELEYWQSIADELGKLTEPYSNNPTQWLFDGHSAGSIEPLHVAVARLLDYRWPQQKQDDLDSLSDADGIVCLPPVWREAPASERLRALLSTACGKDWSAALQDRLLKEVGFASLVDWLRDGVFAQHCALFQNRPFIWHIWDGRKDGFSALVNYHKLDHEKLGRLIYTYLGDWIKTQQHDNEKGVAGAEGRLVAAQDLQKKLEAIREGEPPYDIYVRWKPLHEQPIGWNPDLNDGVRVNIRPFVEAGVLRSRFTINWNKDRGKNPDGSERLNDLHYTIADKQVARRKVGK